MKTAIHTAPTPLPKAGPPASDIVTPETAPEPAALPPSEQTHTWSDDFKIQLLRWVADEGPEVLRPVPYPEAPLGHAYPRLEKHWDIQPGQAVRVLEDLADFGVLSRGLANRVHLCPVCRRWTVNFRETCPNCSGLDVNVEEMVHHLACAYVGLDSEYRDGGDLVCPKCRARLNHLGLDYERPRQTYVCGICHALFEEPIVTAQCLDCRWEGTSRETLVWPIHKYELTDCGREAIEHGDLRVLKLRDATHHGHLQLASREFFELEVAREACRTARYNRPMSILLCRFVVNGAPYPVFHEADRNTVRRFSTLVAEQIRVLDVAALANAFTLALLLPETDESGTAGALIRLGGHFDGFAIQTPRGQPVERQWVRQSWNAPKAGSNEVLEWLQQQLESEPAAALTDLKRIDTRPTAPSTEPPRPRRSRLHGLVRWLVGCGVVLAIGAVLWLSSLQVTAVGVV